MRYLAWDTSQCLRCSSINERVLPSSSGCFHLSLPFLLLPSFWFLSPGFFLDLTYILTPVFSLKSHPAQKSSVPLCKASVPTGLALGREVKAANLPLAVVPGERIFTCVNLSGQRLQTVWVRDFLDLPQVQAVTETTPCGTFFMYPITFQLSEKEPQKPPWRRKEKELSQKGSLWPETQLR